MERRYKIQCTPFCYKNWCTGPFFFAWVIHESEDGTKHVFTLLVVEMVREISTHHWWETHCGWSHDRHDPRSRRRIQRDTDGKALHPLGSNLTVQLCASLRQAFPKTVEMFPPRQEETRNSNISRKSAGTSETLRVVDSTYFEDVLQVPESFLQNPTYSNSCPQQQLQVDRALHICSLSCRVVLYHHLHMAIYARDLMQHLH